MVEIRKNKREESLLKKRLEGTHFMIQNLSGIEKKLQSVLGLVEGLYSEDSALQLEATEQICYLLSTKDYDPPIEEIIKAGVVPRLLKFLAMEDSPPLQYDAAWALTRIASESSENTSVVMDGTVPIFVKLLLSPNYGVRKLAVWALGNFAGDIPKSRDIVLANGALMPLLAHLNEHAELSVLKHATWTLLNLCRGEPPPPFEQVKPAIPVLERLIQSNDEQVVTDACWALSHLFDGSHVEIQAVIETGVCPRLVELLGHQSPDVVIGALRTVGNIVAGNDVQAQAVIAAGIIDPLLQLLHTAEFIVKREAAWAIKNATSCGTREQIKYLVSLGCIRPLGDLLVCPDPKVVMGCMEGLQNILQVGEADKSLGIENVNVYVQMMEEADILEKIENLLHHENTQIYETAVGILDTYWIAWLDEEVESMVSDVSDPSGGFDFK